MITVKLTANLRIKENGMDKLILTGTIFREKRKNDLPEWLLAEIKLCETRLSRNTLIVQEKLGTDQETDANKGDVDPVKSNRLKLRKRNK